MHGWCSFASAPGSADAADERMTHRDGGVRGGDSTRFAGRFAQRGR
jgi:hypothetical protein